MFTLRASFLSVVNSILFPNTRLLRSLLLRYGRIDLRVTQLWFHSTLVTVLSLKQEPQNGSRTSQLSILNSHPN